MRSTVLDQTLEIALRKKLGLRLSNDRMTGDIDDKTALFIVSLGRHIDNCRDIFRGNPGNRVLTLQLQRQRFLQPGVTAYHHDFQNGMSAPQNGMSSSKLSKFAGGASLLIGGG